jgi:hypothetical protein
MSWALSPWVSSFLGEEPWPLVKVFSVVLEILDGQGLWTSFLQCSCELPEQR